MSLKIRFSLVAATFAASVFFGGSSASADTLRVCTTDWPPFTVGGAGGVTGVHTAAVTEAFKRLGSDVKIDNVTWDRCWKEVQNGTYDAIYSASFKPERAESTVYPKIPLQTLSYVALVRKGAEHGWDGKDAAKLPQPVAAPRGYSITGDLKKVTGTTVDDGATSDLQDIQKLLAGRVGTAVVEATVAKALLAQLNAEDKVEILAPAVQSGKDYFVVVGKKHGGGENSAQALADRLDKVLSDLAAEGFVARELAKD